ncbi:MAG: DUF2752 domain-containing protein [Mycobacterium sp.]|uniref:DUF2752 domain-containing protein n=1 Tax=Mycobacterium sp. TaxID=1785 RepID=UPI003CC5ACFC
MRTASASGQPVRSTRQRLGAPALVAAAALTVCAVVWVCDPTTPGGLLPVCPTKSLFGLDCPGCGTLRMLYAVLHGDLPAAVRFNALALTALLSAVPVYAFWAYGRVRGRRLLRWSDFRWTAPVAIVVISAWFVVRNLPFGPFTALRV